MLPCSPPKKSYTTGKHSKQNRIQQQIPLMILVPLLYLKVSVRLTSHLINCIVLEFQWDFMAGIHSLSTWKLEASSQTEPRTFFLLVTNHGATWQFVYTFCFFFDFAIKYVIICHIFVKSCQTRFLWAFVKRSHTFEHMLCVLLVFCFQCQIFFVVFVFF